jgi:hypothetical protein
MKEIERLKPVSQQKKIRIGSAQKRKTSTLDVTSQESKIITPRKIAMARTSNFRIDTRFDANLKESMNVYR